MTRGTPPSAGRLLLSGLLGLVALLLLLATLAGLLGQGHWFLLLATHVRPHLFAVALPCALAALVLRRRLPLAGFLAVLLLNGWFLGQAVLQRAPNATADAAPRGQSVRLMSFNVNYGNLDVARLLAEIEAADADLVFLSEIVPAHRPLMQALSRRYRYAALPAAGGGHGEALFSRFPLGPLERRRASEQASLWIVELALPDGPVTLYGGHPLPPMSTFLDEVHRRWFAAADAALAARPEGERSLLVGDLNATPWSPRLLALLQAHDLHWTGPWAGSWPSGLAPWLGLPIDHLLVGAGIAVRSARLGAPAGSDHRPLIVELLLPPP